MWPSDWYDINTGNVILEHNYHDWQSTLNCECPNELANELFIVAVCYTLSFLFTMLRILEICSITRELGPLLISMTHMVYDLLRFIFILAIFIVAFGVSYLVFKMPNQGMRYIPHDPEFNYISILVTPFIQGLGEVSFTDDFDSGYCTAAQDFKSCFRKLNDNISYAYTNNLACNARYRKVR